MKKNRSIQHFLKAAIALAVALAFVLPGATAFANIDDITANHPQAASSLSDWVMEAESMNVNAGDKNVVVHINGTWNVTLGGYTLGLYYDSTKIEIVDLSLVGTVAEFEVFPGFYVYWSLAWSYNDEVVPSYVTAFSYNTNADPAYDIFAGSGTVFKLIINITLHLAHVFA